MTIEKIVVDSIKALHDMHNAAQKTDTSPSQQSKIQQPVHQVVQPAATEHNNQIGVINAYNRNKRLNIMVISAAAGLIFCLLILTSYREDLPGEVVGIISTVSGIFGACLKDAYSFEFGSSRGSKDKDDKISSTILEKMKY